MSDDDEKLRGTIKYAEADIDEDEIFDATDFLELIEEGDGTDLDRTDPFMKALVDVTRQHDIPLDLLWKSMRPDEGWIETEAMVGRNGLLRLSAEAYDKLVPGERVEIRVRRLKSNVDETVDSDDSSD